MIRKTPSTTCPDPSRDLTSIGQLAAHVQRPVRAIEAAAERLGIVPAWRLNHVPYFDAAQIEKLTDALRRDDR